MAPLNAVPGNMVAEIRRGINFNLSFWYKLTDRTIRGAWFSGAGCIILIATNILFIPQYGFMACAWGGVAGYGTATLLSYFVGQHYYPIDYPLRRIGGYALLTAGLYAVMTCTAGIIPSAFLRICLNTLLILIFVAAVARYDFPIRQLPVVGRFFR